MSVALQCEASAVQLYRVRTTSDLYPLSLLARCTYSWFLKSTDVTIASKERAKELSIAIRRFDVPDMTHINFFDLTGIRPINSDANGDFSQKLELELPHPRV